jgi:uncharacterized LabA/DUF88 family protein
LARIGYDLVLKPVKIFIQPDGSKVRKANCDVDLTFYAMRDLVLYNHVIFFSGDGDFQILLEYFVKLKKKVVIFANSKRTAKEVKRIKGVQFNDMGVLRNTINFAKK